MKSRRAANPTVFTAYARRYYRANRTARLNMTKIWRSSNITSIASYSKARTEVLCDSYIAGQLSKHGPLPDNPEILRDLIEAKRWILKVKRLVKGKKDGT